MMPMQWRIAVSWISGYFVFYMFTPVLFQYRGPIVSGQMGMTWSLVNALSLVSSAWIAPRAPYFGILIAQQKYAQLDKLFWRLVIIVTAIASLGASSIWTLIYILYKLQIPFASRFLPPMPTGLFLLATVILVISIPFATYLRAHKKEPLMLLSLISAIFVCMSNLVFGKYFGATGMASGYLAVNALIIPFIFLIWYRCRAQWHI